MIRRAGVFVAWVAFMWGAACTPTPPPEPPAPDHARAIRDVIALDAEASRKRNTDSEHGPLAKSIRDYVDALDGFDLGACPDDFRAALEEHRDAWAATVPYLEDFPDLRGEMHDLFEQLQADSNPRASEFEALVAEVFETWEPVEAAMRAHGVEP